jgi:hypothetical protein
VQAPALDRTHDLIRSFRLMLGRLEKLIGLF